MPYQEIERLNRLIAENPGDPELLLERGKLHLKTGDRGEALNDFTEVIELTGAHPEAQGYIDMINEIFVFFHPDNYNP